MTDFLSTRLRTPIIWPGRRIPIIHPGSHRGCDHGGAHSHADEGVFIRASEAVPGPGPIVRYSWNQPKCERCWIDHEGKWEPLASHPEAERLLEVRSPVRVSEVELETCSWCGEPTIFGVFVRADPRSVPYPAITPNG